MSRRSEIVVPRLALVGSETVRAAFELALEPSWFSVVATANTTEELLSGARPEVEAVVLGLTGGKGGLEAETVRMLRQGLSGCLLIVAGAGDSRIAARAALRSGADGYVPLVDLARRLSLTLAAVLVGQLCVPREARLEVTPPLLSHREREVLQLASAGLTNGSIAARLYLSESTVKTHLSSGFRKLGVGSRAEAALALELTGQASTPLVTPAPHTGPGRAVATVVVR